MRYGVYLQSGHAELIDASDILPVGDWIYLVSVVDGVQCTEGFFRREDVVYIKHMPLQTESTHRTKTKIGTQEPVLVPEPPAPILAKNSDELTRRQREVLMELVRGCDVTEIASKLSLSQDTIEYHIGHLYRRLGITPRNRKELVRIGVEWYPLIAHEARRYSS